MFRYDGDEESFVEIIIQINNEYSVDSSSSIGGMYIIISRGGGVDGRGIKMRLPHFMCVCRKIFDHHCACIQARPLNFMLVYV